MILVSEVTPCWASFLIDDLTADLKFFKAGRSTTINLTATITDQAVISSSIILEQQIEDGPWKVLGQLPAGKTLGQFSCPIPIRAPQQDDLVRFRVSAKFLGHESLIQSTILEVPVLPIIYPGKRTTITGPPKSNLSLTIPANALTVPVYAAVTKKNPQSLTVDLAGRIPDAIVKITFQLQNAHEGPVLTKPLLLRVPAPAGTPEGTRFNVSVPIMADSPNGEGQKEQLLAVDTAVAKQGMLITQGDVFSGIFGAGEFIFLRELGSGDVKGTIVGRDNSPRAGAYVYALITHTDGSSTEYINPFVFFTDVNGTFKIPIDPCAPRKNDAGEETCIKPPSASSLRFQVEALDGQRCSLGRSNTQPIPSEDATLNTGNIQLHNYPNIVAPNPNDSAVLRVIEQIPSARGGVTNGGFELGQLTKCVLGLQLSPVQMMTTHQGPAPSEGKWMASGRISNAAGAINFLQKIKIPLGVKTLSFDYWFGRFDRMIGPNFSVYLVKEGQFINTNLPPAFSGNNFSRDFQTGSIDLSTFSRTVTSNSTKAIALFRFSCIGCLFSGPMHPNISVPVLLDNIRFSTVFVDVKVLQGSMTDLSTDAARFERVRQMVRDTNEILAQVGVNVRIRRLMTNAAAVDERGESLTHPCPEALNQPSLLNLPIGAPPAVHRSVQDVLGLCRSSVSTDVNLYFVNSFTDGFFGATNGIAVGPDDYTLTGTPGAGLIIRNINTMIINDPEGNPLTGLTLSTARANRKREVLAHELGHLLIGGVEANKPKPEEDDNSKEKIPLEHKADPGNLMSDNRCTPPPPKPDDLSSIPCSSRPLLSAAQSQQIHVTNGGGFLVP